jgi:immune inhibitor A
MRLRAPMVILVLALILTLFGARFGFAMPPRPDLIQKLWEEDRLEEARAVLGEEMLRAEALSAHAASPIALPDTVKVLVLLVDFDDVKADTILHSRQWFERMLFDPANPLSLRNYFLANSYGKLDMTGEVYGWFRAAQKLSYYADGRRGMGPYPRNAEKLVEDAISAADPSVDFSRFDVDAPMGVVDFLLVVHAGQGFEWTMNPNDIHSHAGTIRDKFVDGVKVTEYATEPEDGRVGTFAHELGHLLGLPDLYDVTLNSYGLGMWSLMSYGSWGGGDGSHPVGLDAWSKARLGFLSPAALEENARDLEIPCAEDQPFALRLWSEGEPGPQYFLVENRRAKSYDSYLANFGEGLLVYHVDERYGGNSGETRHLVYLEQADGRFDLDKQRFFGFGSDKGDPFPGSGGARTFSWWTAPDNRSNEDQPTEVSLRNISDPGDTMKADVEVMSPVIVFDSYLVDDVLGDRDGEPDPGEEIVLRVRLKNQGIRCEGVAAQVSTADPFVVVSQSSAQLSFVAAHDFSAYLGFKVTILEGTPEPHNVGFVMNIAGTSEAGGYSSSEQFVLAVPLRRLEGWPQSAADVVFSPPAVADLDKDGLKEIVLGSYDGRLYAWRANGTLLPGWPANMGGRTTSKPAICDVDMDGNLDVIVGSQDGAVHVFGKDGRPLPGWPQATGGTVVASPLLADIDDDGVVEIICGSKDGKVYAWNGDGTTVKGWPFLIKGREIWMSPAAADFDGDYVPEVVVGAYASQLYILKGDGTPLPGWPILFGYGCGDGSPAIADFDGDGTLEIAVSGLLSNSVYIVGVDGKVRRGWPKWAYNCAALSSPIPADLDSDGLPEIAVSTSCGTIVAWNDDGSPSTALDVATSEVVQYCEPLFADLDGNGLVECVLGTAGGSTSHVYAFGREGKLVGFPVDVDGSVWATPAVADLDNDGYDEIVAATTEGRVYVWRFVGAKQAGRSEWSQSRGDLWNTGYYGFRPLDNIPLPDLAVTAGDILFRPEKPRQGDNVAISVRLANLGHASADNFRVNIFESDTLDSLLIGSTTVASLGAKRDTTLLFTWSVPGGEPTRLVWASLDPDNNVPERFELNNVARQRFYLAVADLGTAITDVRPLPATIGDSLTVNAVVTNTGEDVARSFEVAFYDSSAGARRRFAGVSIDSLAPGREARVSARYAVGRFSDDLVTLVCEASPDRGVLEYYLSNNTSRFAVNSGLQGRILVSPFGVGANSARLSRTTLVVEPSVCACLAILRLEEPFEVIFETLGSDPDISRNTVVYSSDGDIAGFDLKTGIPFLVSAGPDYESQPAVWGENIVWVTEGVESASVVLRRGSGSPVALRTVADGTISNPDVSSEAVVWEERRQGRSEIWCYDLSAGSLSAVAPGEGDQVNPAIWGRTVVWEERSPDGGDIYAANLGSSARVAVAGPGGAQRYPDIYGDIVVWQDSRNGNWDIYGRSLAKDEEFPISRQIDDQVFPSISESTVVWVDRRGADRHIMGLVFGGTRRVAEVRKLEALSQDARIRIDMEIDEYEDGVAYKLYRFSENKPMPADKEGNVQEMFRLRGDSVHVYQDSVVAERRTYYYTLGIVDGYGDETFYGPASGQAYRRSPKEFTVGNPYPNPFRQGIDVAFGLPRRLLRRDDATWPDPSPEVTAVEAKVYSVTGSLVRTLHKGMMTPGYYRLAWDGTNEAGAEVSAGVYFISVSAGSSRYTKKVVLAR